MGFQSNYLSRRFSKSAKAMAEARTRDAAGVVHCAACGVALPTKAERRYDHRIAYAISAWSGPRNCDVLCVADHDRKTREADVPVIAKVKRLRRRTRSRHPLPCSRASGLTKPLFGPPRPRQSLGEKLAAMRLARSFDGGAS
jgi:hypothetical protein